MFQSSKEERFDWIVNARHNVPILFPKIVAFDPSDRESYGKKSIEDGA